MNELADRYGHKIKTLNALIGEIGKFPRKKSVVVCHGVFDVVHPGHLRHLIYAKSKSNILVASITADLHINKGKHRPHVPQDLRALNLAAMDFVDYVIIDSNATPIENLTNIKPDFFAKGYEYIEAGLNPKTSEEEACVLKYGGEILFTPGDVVYSSSKLIEMNPPKIKHDKLITLMSAYNLTFDDLKHCVVAMRGKTVHVVGDTIVDTITTCSMIGGQTKTPTMSVLYEGKKNYVGGAGVVAKHLKAAGAKVKFSTVLGDDDYGSFVQKDLREFGVELDTKVDPSRPTTNKNAIVTGGYRLLKLDTLDNSSISDRILQELCQSIEKSNSQALVYSDFRHGIFNGRTIPAFLSALPEKRFCVADSQVASRWGNITEFKGFDLITPNEREARFALADQDSGLRPLASKLYDQAECKLLLLKLGERGLIACRNADHTSNDSFFVLDSFADYVKDAVGSGDALLAYSTLAMISSDNNEVLSTIIGLFAAAVECEFDGNIPVTPDDLLQKITNIEKQINFGA